MHTINNPYGQVQRVVIFKKNGVQAMVEYPFDDVKTINFGIFFLIEHVLNMNEKMIKYLHKQL